MNFALPILQSLQALTVSKEKGSKKYQIDTETDSDHLCAFILGKFPNLPLDINKNVKYNCFFWEQDKSVSIVAQSPSSRLNAAFEAIYAYVDEHYDRIVKDFEKILEDNEQVDSDEGENSDEEPEF